MRAVNPGSCMCVGGRKSDGWVVVLDGTRAGEAVKWCVIWEEVEEVYEACRGKPPWIRTWCVVSGVGGRRVDRNLRRKNKGD